MGEYGPLVTMFGSIETGGRVVEVVVVDGVAVVVVVAEVVAVVVRLVPTVVGLGDGLDVVTVTDADGNGDEALGRTSTRTTASLGSMKDKNDGNEPQLARRVPKEKWCESLPRILSAI